MIVEDYIVIFFIFFPSWIIFLNIFDKNAYFMPSTVMPALYISSHLILTTQQVRLVIYIFTIEIQRNQVTCLRPRCSSMTLKKNLFEHTSDTTALSSTWSFFKSGQIKVSLFGCHFKV